MEFKPTSRKRNREGFTLVELMVGVALGMLLLITVGSLYLFGLTSFATMSNYAELSSKNRYASDLISRDIRSASKVVSVTTDQLVLRFARADVTYTFDPEEGTLTRLQFGQARILLRGVD